LKDTIQALEDKINDMQREREIV